MYIVDGVGNKIPPQNSYHLWQVSAQIATLISKEIPSNTISHKHKMHIYAGGQKDKCNAYK